MFWKLLSVWSVVVLVMGCARNEPKPAAPAAPIISWEKKTAEATYCGSDTSACAEYIAHYQYFTGAGTLPALLNSVTDSFITSLLGLEDNSRLFSPDSATHQLIQDYKKFKQENPDALIGWSVQAETEVPYKTDQFITIDLMGDYYLGGAHPNTSRIIRTYVLATGKELAVQDLIKDRAQLVKLLEKKYKAEKDMPDTTDLKELTFDGSPLPLPANIALMADGLLFFYNDYEVAPHAVGPTEIKLTWAEMGSSVVLPN
jgi:hypothetical protein